VKAVSFNEKLGLRCDAPIGLEAEVPMARLTSDVGAAARAHLARYMRFSSRDRLLREVLRDPSFFRGGCAPPYARKAISGWLRPRPPMRPRPR